MPITPIRVSAGQMLHHEVPAANQRAGQKSRAALQGLGALHPRPQFRIREQVQRSGSSHAEGSNTASNAIRASRHRIT